LSEKLSFKANFLIFGIRNREPRKTKIGKRNNLEVKNKFKFSVNILVSTVIKMQIYKKLIQILARKQPVKKNTFLNSSVFSHISKCDGIRLKIIMLHKKISKNSISHILRFN